MTITIKIDTGNAAFEDRATEISRILHQWLDREGDFARGTVKLHDYNGNTVGSVTVTGK